MGAQATSASLDRDQPYRCGSLALRLALPRAAKFRIDLPAVRVGSRGGAQSLRRGRRGTCCGASPASSITPGGQTGRRRRRPGRPRRRSRTAAMRRRRSRRLSSRRHRGRRDRTCRASRLFTFRTFPDRTSPGPGRLRAPDAGSRRRTSCPASGHTSCPAGLRRRRVRRAVRIRTTPHARLRENSRVLRVGSRVKNGKYFERIRRATSASSPAS